jgi:hypothetical protein
MKTLRHIIENLEKQGRFAPSGAEGMKSVANEIVHTSHCYSSGAALNSGQGGKSLV